MSNNTTSLVAKVISLVVTVFVFIWDKLYLFNRQHIMSCILISLMIIAIVVSIIRGLRKETVE